MKLKFLAAIFLSALSMGCQTTKAKACKGCLGAELQECQFAYEDCPNLPNCRRSDLKRLYADQICLYADESTQ